MFISKTVTAILLACAGCMSLLLDSASGQTFQAGAATSNITPPLGLNIVGGFSPAPSTHVHDELHARCLVLDDGQTRLALVVCDLLGIHRLVSDEARKLIEERTKIPREQRADLGHAHALGLERPWAGSLRARAKARRISEVRRPADCRRRSAGREQSAAGGDGVRHRRSAGARFQSPLVHAAGDRARPIRSARPTS